MQKIKDADLASDYFVTLRARVVAFGSHDMTRAFDNWTDAYRTALTSGQSEARESARRQLVSSDEHVGTEPVFWLRRTFNPSASDGNQAA